jgi:hypothetical protein
MAMDTDPRKLAEDVLASEYFPAKEVEVLARELLKALDERDEALRTVGEETRIYIEELEAERDRLREALRPFVENWDFHAADYLAELVDGEECRILPARVVADIIEARKIARAALEEK